MNTSFINKIFLSLLLITFISLTACSSGGNGSPDPTGKSALSGIVKQSTGNPLAGATISLENTTKTTTTDANGIFVIPDTLKGDYVVDIDGTTASGDVGTSYGVLKIFTTVGSDPVSNLEQVIILPNLSSVATAVDMVTATAGTVAGGISAVNGDVQLGSNNLNVVVQIDGANADGNIEISATPVPLTDLPMTLPESAGANVASFVTIQPALATFDPPLDLTIPNDQGLAPGTLVDIYSFDHDVNDWVNRSAESTPSNQGVVSADGSVIEANGVISKGGWHGPLIPADYLETVIGTVKEGATPLAGILVFTNTGQSGITGADGTFSINVPVVGTSIDIYLIVTAPVDRGGISAVTTVPMGSADDAIDLDYGMIDLVIPTTGNLTGTALNLGNPSTQDISITGPMNTTITPNTDGTFFLSGLPAGSYTASTILTGDTVATTVNFTIVVGQITVVLIEKATVNNVAVKVFLLDENLSEPIVANDTTYKATVTLSQGNTALTQTTNANGLATFNNITGAVTVTGQIDSASNANNGLNVIRSGVTIHDITPVNGQIGLPLIYIDGEFIIPVTGTTIEGTISNIPAIPTGYNLAVFAQSASDICCNTFPLIVDPASIVGGSASYSLGGGSGLGEGEYIVIAVIAKEDGSDITLFHSAAILDSKVSTTAGASATAENLNFNSAAMKIEFDNKSFTYNNNSAATDARITNEVRLATGEVVEFEIFSSSFSQLNTLPTTGTFVSAAPITTSTTYTLEFSDFSQTTFNSQSQEATLVSNSATNLVFDLIDIPSITSPANQQILSAAEAKNMTVNWSAPPSNSDLVSVSLFSSQTSTIPGVNAVFWLHQLPGNSTSMTMPSTTVDTLQMFEPGITYGIDVSHNNISVVFDFDAFLDFNVTSNIKNIFYKNDNASSSNEVIFSTSP